jgi:hypothetical protein
MRDIRSETEDTDASAPYSIDCGNEALAIAALWYGTSEGIR